MTIESETGQSGSNLLENLAYVHVDHTAFRPLSGLLLSFREIVLRFYDFAFPLFDSTERLCCRRLTIEEIGLEERERFTTARAFSVQPLIIDQLVENILL